MNVCVVRESVCVCSERVRKKRLRVSGREKSWEKFPVLKYFYEARFAPSFTETFSTKRCFIKVMKNCRFQVDPDGKEDHLERWQRHFWRHFRRKRVSQTRCPVPQSRLKRERVQPCRDVQQQRDAPAAPEVPRDRDQPDPGWALRQGQP